MANKVAFNKELPDITKSEEIWARSVGLIPAGTQTLAKGPTQFTEGVAPKYLERGKGARVWDVDGNEYLDFNMGIGPLILGYCHAEVDAAIRKQLEDGITFSLMHPLELALAELMRQCIPNAESVRFSKTGCDVTSAAVRLARAYTGREKVLCCGYHGWHDWYVAVTDRNAGVPAFNAELAHTFQYNAIDSVTAAIDKDTACVILEPFAFEREQNGFLSALREVCDKFGVLLVFDEMWTGFRCALGGAQEFIGVRADLSVFSKAMANGMPISALTGRREVMRLLDEKVFFFTTFGGEALSLAASIACINVIRRDGVIAHLANTGQRLVGGLDRLLQELAIDFVLVSGYPFRTLMNFTAQSASPWEMKTLVQQELLRRGILWSGMHNMCHAHTPQDIDYALEAFAEVLVVLRDAVRAGTVGDLLCGKVVQPVFRRVG